MSVRKLPSGGEAGSGSGTVTSVSSADGNLTVATGTTTPVLTIVNSPTVTTNANMTGDVTSVGNATTIAAGVIVNADINASAAIDATKIADGTVTSTEFQYINTLTSNAQTQINTKVTGPASATDGAIVVFDGTTGKLIKNSVITVIGSTINSTTPNTLGLEGYDATGAAVGGAVEINGGAGGATSGVGGAVNITAGLSQGGNSAGGAIAITAGDGNGTGAGGAAALTAGNGGTGGAGGAASLRSGDGTAGGAGGTITIQSGTGGSGATGGAIFMSSGGTAGSLTGGIEIATADGTAIGSASGSIDFTIGTPGAGGTAGDFIFTGGKTLNNNLTASRAIATDASKYLVSSATTATELGYVNGVTSGIQAQIDAKFTLPALTSGSVLFSNGTTIAQDNANFFWNDSTNRLGIATASPAAHVDINTTGVVDVSQLTGASNVATLDYYQSFTPTVTGTFTSVWLKHISSSGVGITLSVYTGTGTGGTLLMTEAGFTGGADNVLKQFSFASPPFLIASSVYTVRIQSTNGSTNLNPRFANGTNPYSGGSSDVAANSDLIFETYMGPDALRIGGATKILVGSIIYPTADSTAAINITNAAGANIMSFDTTNSRVSIGVTTPTAKLHLKAGTTAASTAPLKFTSGSLMTAAEAGAEEFLSDKFYGTITTGAARKEFTLNDAALTSGRVPFATTNGRLTDDADMTFSTDTLTVTKIAATTFTGNVTIGDGINIVANTTTGTKIGTGTTQKLGFYNATPIVQGASVADASGGAVIDAEARAAINALISRIEALGLIATV